MTAYPADDRSGPMAPGHDVGTGSRERQARHNVVTFILIVLVALIARAVYLIQARDVPFFEYLLVDSLRYDAWARDIASGDWLGEAVFFQAPLYPYCLALLYKLLGADPWRACLAQIVLGSLSCGLLYLAGAWFVSRPAGIAAGLLLAFYAPAVFFDGLIQKASLACMLMTGLLALLGWSLRAPRTIVFAVIGVTLGLLSLTRENARVLVLPVTAWVLIHPSVSRRRRGAWALAAVAGMAVTLMPVVTRNYLVGREFVVSSSQLGPNFFMGNNPDSRGTYMSLVPGQHNPDQEEANARRLAEQALGRELSSREVSHFWVIRAWEYIRSRPGHWLRLLAAKWGLVWNAYEIPDANDLYFYEGYSSLLRGLNRVGHFGVLCPLAAAGLVLTWDRRRDLWVLYATMLTIALSVTAFFVLARYRFPLVPVLSIPAGAALVEAPRLLRQGAGRVALLLLVIAGTAMFCNRPVAIAGDMRSLAYMNYADVLSRQGKLTEAVEQLEKGLALVPDDAEGQHDAGVAYLRLRQYDKAVEHFRAAIEIDAGYAQAHNRLGVALGMQRRFEEAVVHLGRAVELQPHHAEFWNDWGNAERYLGEMEAAERAFRTALRIQPDFTRAAMNLSELCLSQERYTEAVAVAESLCAQSGYQDPAHLAILAEVCAAAGRFEQAVDAVDRAIQLAEAAGNTEATAALRKDKDRYVAEISPPGAEERGQADAAEH